MGESHFEGPQRGYTSRRRSRIEATARSTRAAGDRRVLTTRTAAITLLLGFAIGAADAHGNAPEAEEKRIPTALLDLRVRIYDGLVDPMQFGGGVATLGDRYLLAARTGELYVFDWDPDTDGLRFERLELRVPLNLTEFKEGAGDEANNLWFRVADIAIQELGDRLRLLVSHHRWKQDAGCSVLRVSTIEGERDAILGSAGELKWKRLFDTKPCLEIQSGNRGHPFQGNHVGGRLALIDDAQLLLSVGDHGFDGWDTEPMLPQDVSNSYGKIVQIDLDTGDSQIVSRGHRNPQGLHIAADGKIWSTEHGPRGGDELNLIRRGANYGWPLVTYGIGYKRADWPLSKRQGSHEGYEEPFFSWTPSIAVSNLISAGGDAFSLWRGDLLVS
jgi:hypothetical protein